MFKLPLLAAALSSTIAPASPSAEAERLGRQLAETGVLATMLPLQAAAETDAMIAAHPELDSADRDALRSIAKAHAKIATDRVLTAEARRYASTLSLRDLRILAAAAQSPAARHLRAARPGVIKAAMTAMDGVDFRRETLEAFCAKTGKACPTQR